jgi:hypothetical protein
MRATSVAFLPSVRLYKPAGKVSAALSPDENPFDPGSLAAVAEKSNSRFFTDCYHEAAAIEPPSGRKPGLALQDLMFAGYRMNTLGRTSLPKLIF